MIWVLVALLLGVTVYDLLQRRHAILRNFPVIGHFRYLLEAIGPELRQYIVTGNDEELPFSRDQRRWVYASAKKQNNYFGFGTDNAMDATDYLVLKHAAFPHRPAAQEGPQVVPCAKVLGAARERPGAFRPDSLVTISAMSFGSLSGPAIEALNRGCALMGALHNTGEGGISPHHLHGGPLVWQLGTGYFGARDADGFSLARLCEQVEQHPVRAIEIKLSQGAKPGKGGVLPAAKITPEIAGIRGIPLDQDCISPSGHTEFSCADELLDFVERLAEATGVPVGIKSAVGELDFWEDLARLMDTTDRGVDFIQIDGGEGGTGAAPLVFSDHVSLPFRVGFPRVYRAFAERGLHHQVVFIGSGKLGFPADALLGMALGCDLISVAREVMLAIGCIQAQRCHSGHCPTGVATQNRWLVRGLDPTSKAHRAANYLLQLNAEMDGLAHACGVAHPALVTLDHFELMRGALDAVPARGHFDYAPDWGLPSPTDRASCAER